jgi:hypothetical protein
LIAADARVPRALPIVVAAALVVCAVILWLTRTFTFYFDEWTFISTAPDWTLATFFKPHNEHPAILFRLVYSALLNTVGLRSYLPYMAALVIAHAANVVLIFELIRRRSGDLVAMAAALLLLVLGAGWEDLLWAFQMAWLGSVAFGLGALLVLQTPRRIAPATALLAASLACSGIGIVFAVAATVQLALTPRRRRQLLWLVPVGVALAAWYGAFGRFGNHPNPQPTAGNVLVDPLYALWGLGQAAAGIIGEGGWFGPPLLLVAVAVLAWRWKRHGADSFALGIAAGLVAFYLVTGLTRAQLGYQQSGASRYVYVGAALWLILLADAARDLPWRGTWRPALAACLFLACFSSAVLLFSFAIARPVVMARQVADYYALAAERSDPCLDPAGAVDLYVMPAVPRPSLYYRAVDRYGDPRAGMPLRDVASYEMGVRNLRKADC